MSLPGNYRLVSILFTIEDGDSSTEDLYTVMTDLPSAMISDIVENNPQEAIKELLKTNRVFIMESHLINEEFHVTYRRTN